MSLETLIKTAYSDIMRTELWKELTAGRLLDPTFLKDMKLGDEVNCQFSDLVQMSDWNGGDLDISNVQVTSATTVKVKINHGKSVFFTLDKAKIQQIERADDKEKVRLIKDFMKDSREQFARAVNKACCDEYVRAGHIVEGANHAAIVVTTNNIQSIFAEAKKKLKDGDGKGHTAWKNGEMIAVISTGMEAFLTTQGLLQYSDKMAASYTDGYIGRFMGFDILVDDVAVDSNGYEYPLFGRQKKTMAGGIQDDFSLESGKPVGGFNTYYWGEGVFGVKAPLSYLLATAKLSVSYSAAA